MKPEKLEPFSLSEDLDPEEAPKEQKEQKNRPPDFLAVRNAVATLQPGEVSEFVPQKKEESSPFSRNVICLTKQVSSETSRFRTRILTNKREIVFYEWLHDRQEDAGISFARG